MNVAYVLRAYRPYASVEMAADATCFRHSTNLIACKYIIQQNLPTNHMYGRSPIAWQDFKSRLVHHHHHLVRTASSPRSPLFQLLPQSSFQVA
jgi:hypothetical protein